MSFLSNKVPHLLSLSQLQKEDILALFEKAKTNITVSEQISKKKHNYVGRTQINLFFENSTRTQASFEIAGKRLGLDVVNFSTAHSSLKKGETLLDTVYTFESMKPDLLVVRHPASGAAVFLAKNTKCAVINAGDGKHEHPSQALLDALTIFEAKKTISGLTIAICGDILHSRVARSNILSLSTLGNQIRLISPKTLLPSYAEKMGVDVFYDLKEGLKNADVVIILRLQQERMQGAFLPNLEEYYHFYGLTKNALNYAKRDCIVLHPGPMNRGVEICSSIADGKQSYIRKQVEMGVAMRMAIIETLLDHKEN